ncbi:MAG TPA: thiosulfate oxidation carrier complex protein SoxZ [Burkholderiales bacterium]|jgi:sulfur-oxidizing protein SoxZ|nr:thiosulfate oxidation carrier complex protein SoxZ [Burkholderiales bacterium]
MTARIQVPPKARRGEAVEVRIVIQHPMETGFRYDAMGGRTPRNVIHTLVCRYGGAEVFRADMGAGIAANPFLRFFVRASEPGDIECSWVDSENASGTVSARLTVAV